MITLRALPLLGFVAVVPAILVGCPQGGGFEVPGQDGGADAGEASVRHSEAGAGEGGAEGGTPAGNGGAGGSGALCGASGRDDCGAFLLCAETLGCVECKNDGDCPAASARCLEGTCVGCRPSATPSDAGVPNCQGATSACWASDDQCHAPCDDAHACPAGNTCDRASGACVGCTVTADCSTGVCSPTRRRCVECIADTTCPTNRPRCRVLTGTCEACTSNDDCGHAMPICDPLTFTCRVGCSSNAQCPGQQCNVATAQCVALPVDAGVADAASAADAGH